LGGGKLGEGGGSVHKADNDTVTKKWRKKVLEVKCNFHQIFEDFEVKGRDRVRSPFFELRKKG